MSKEHHFRSYLSNFLANHVLVSILALTKQKMKISKLFPAHLIQIQFVCFPLKQQAGHITCPGKTERHPANMECHYILNRYFIS